jgi:prolyl oligopeptidase PreP (S9A serine peptidase family)
LGLDLHQSAQHEHQHRSWADYEAVYEDLMGRRIAMEFVYATKRLVD